MSKVLIEEQTLYDIGNAIRKKKGVSTTYKPGEMHTEIDHISTDLIVGSSAPSSSIGYDGSIYKRVNIVPANVTFLDYLRSDGYAYIDTGIYAKDSIDAYIKFKHINGSDSALFGCRTGGFTSQSKILYLNDGPEAARFFKAADLFNGFSKNAVSLIDGSICEANTVTKKLDNKYYYATFVNASLVMYVHGQNEYVSDHPIRIFGLNAGTEAAADEPGQIYRLSFWEEGSPIADYIPCLDENGVACMFDTISGEYIYNNGSSDFTTGNVLDSQPQPLDAVYYVKSNGTWRVIGW